MLTLRIEVDKKVNDLLMREVKTLDWATVPFGEFEHIEDKRLKLCPTELLILHPCSHFSTEVNLDIVTRIARGMKNKKYHKSYSSSETLRSLFHKWLSTDILKDNIQYIINVIDTYSSLYFTSTLYTTLVAKGLIKFTDVNINLDNVNRNLSLLVPSVTQETWIDLVKNTNYLDYMFQYEGCVSEFHALPLYNDQLKSLGLPEIKNHTLTELKNYDEDSDYYSEFFKDYVDNDIIKWDTLIDNFYADKNCSFDGEILNMYWKFALEVQDADKLTYNYKNESRPESWTLYDV